MLGLISQSLDGYTYVMKNIEKRAPPRYSFETPIFVTEPGFDLYPVPVKSINVSLGGLCLSSLRPIIENKVVHLDLLWMGHEWALQGRVAYCRRLDGLNHRIGIEFVQMSSQLKTRLQSAIGKLDRGLII